MDEPAIIINGHTLTTAQAMAVRVAISSFYTEMGEPDVLGDDEHGRQMWLQLIARASPRYFASLVLYPHRGTPE